MFKRYLIATVLATTLSVVVSMLHAQPQTAVQLLKEGERLHMAYEFERAIEAFSRAAAASEDSLLTQRAEQWKWASENGQIMSRYVIRPTLLAYAVIPGKEFPLYYDLAPSGQWRYPPKELLEHVHDDGKNPLPILYRPSVDKIVFAARDTSQNTGWDLYTVWRTVPDTPQASDTADGQDPNTTYWSPPVRLPASINTTRNEMYPVLSPDGNTLYFCSDGLPGLGGMNLFVSHWDKDLGTWSVPENMGIPFSSPHNDMLYLLSDDSRYFYFVSDRIAPKDSLMLYKVEYEPGPVTIHPQSVQELREIASLPLVQKVKSGAVPVPAEPEEATLPARTNEREQDRADSVLQKTRAATQHYAELNKAVRNLTEQVAGQEQKLDELRNTYTTLSREEDRQVYANLIRDREFTLMELQQSLRDTQKAAQAIEDMFLWHGVLAVPPQTPDMQVEPAETQANIPRFTPVKQKQGTWDKHVFLSPAPPPPTVDLTFRIEKEAVIVPWENEPMSLYYRIQLFTLSSKITPKQLRGISPAFEVKVGNKYVYYAGQFTKYAQATQALTTVRRQGVHGALVVAFYEGKSLSLQEARKREAQNKTEPEGIRTYRVYLGQDEVSPQLVAAVTSLTEKDIIRVEKEEAAHFYIGPFNSLTQAQELAEGLQKKGFTSISVQEDF
ncbi:MAG TPA: hypothetical protein GXX61_03105 [Bacteroidales bacterium]|jgi:hypothetical protein|nr:hypothetical protein [Bacteroidales bacterium]